MDGMDRWHGLPFPGGSQKGGSFYVSFLEESGILNVPIELFIH